MNRQRVVIAGLGDVGVLTAIRLARHSDVVGISVKPALVSGQELGIRLSRPHDWARDNWIPFDRFRGSMGRSAELEATVDLVAGRGVELVVEFAEQDGFFMRGIKFGPPNSLSAMMPFSPAGAQLEAPSNRKAPCSVSRLRVHWSWM